MSIKINEMNSKPMQEKLEERVKYFLKYQPQITKKHKNLKRNENNDNYATLIDPLNIRSDKINQNYNSRNDKNNNKNKENDNINSIKEKLNESTLSTGPNDISDIPIKKSVSIQVSKELAKYAEPRFQKTEFLKLPQKFNISNEIFDTEPNINNIKNSKNKKSRHRYTNSELELLETDEKVPQEQIEEITNNNISNLSISNIEDIYCDKNILYIFHFLANIEKCYQELSKDLKGNGLKNIDYKLKVAYSFLGIIMDDKNLLSKIFLYNEDDINVFLNRELCIYLSILFLDNFAKGLNENQIKEFLICLNYCHINLLYVILIVIKKIEEAISENKIKFEENSLEYNDFKKCKVLIELNNDKINIKKYKENFHTNNKIIKNIFLNILNIFRDINENIAQNIIEIFNLSKTAKFRTIIINHIKTNFLINEKINEVINKYQYPEDSIQKDNSKNNDQNNENSEINDLKNINPQEEIKVPFLPPKKSDDKRDYCLVLDLDETLVHFFEDNFEAYVKVRMGAEHFITVLSQYCEIVIFTASTKYYCDIVIDGLDCKNLIDYKLYREHTYDYNGINVKDLSKLGRDLTKIIIIDNIEENYSFQPNNGLNIIDFEGDENDNELQFLLQDLLEVVTVPGKNVLDELPRIRKNMQKRYCNIVDN